MSNAPVSVIVPCYNAEASIGETLESVFIQSGVDLQVIVVDDGSTDRSAELIAKAFPQAILHRQPNAGASAARNRGFALSTQPLIQFLDSDDLLEPGKLAAQAAALTSDSNADIAYGDWDKIHWRENAWHVESTITKRLNPGTEEVDIFLANFWAPPAVYLMTRDIVTRAGPWSATLPVIQDARFMLDCWLAGARFVHCPGKMARYRLHDVGSLSTRNRAAFQHDCLTNAMEMYEWWNSRKRLDDARKRAVVSVAANLANAAYDNDPAIAEAAYRFVVQIEPDYRPERPALMRWLAALFGYHFALWVAWNKRRVQNWVRGPARI